MKKPFIMLFSVLCIAISASAQKEYKLSKSSGQLNLNIPGAIVEGYSGNEIIFSLPKGESETEDERAKGLRVITGSGFTDNTGLGIDVTEKGSEINVNAVSKNMQGILTIKVPQNIKISFVNKSSMQSNELILKNLKNEIEVSVNYNQIKLENNSGPMNVKTLYGSVDAIFNESIKGPISIVSVYGYVDVSLPSTVKANVELSSGYGKLYAADKFKINIDQSVKPKTETSSTIATLNRSSGQATSGTGTIINGLTAATDGAQSFMQIGGRNSEHIKGTINGGGADLIIKSSYKNVYLREK